MTTVECLCLDVHIFLYLCTFTFLQDTLLYTPLLWNIFSVHFLLYPKLYESSQSVQIEKSRSYVTLVEPLA